MIYNSIFTVVTPASDYSLAALATVKDELGITDSSQDTRLTRWITEAGAVIQGPQGIGRVLRSEAVTETFRAMAYQPNAFGEHYYPRIGTYHQPESVPGLRLRRYPIVAVASIVADGVTLDPVLDYEVDAEPGLVYRLVGAARVPWYGQLLVIAYSGGYPTLGNVPLDIQSAVLLMLKHRRAAQTRDPMLRQLNVPGVIEQQFWVGTSGDSNALPPEVEGLICGYRDHHV